MKQSNPSDKLSNLIFYRQKRGRLLGIVSVKNLAQEITANNLVHSTVIP